MSRGDQARKAAHRKAVAEVATDLASYQHRVAKLTAENRELNERLAVQERTAKQTERRLRAERDEGVAPQVEALTLAMQAAIKERDAARATAARRQETVSRWFDRFIDHLKTEHNMTGTAATELIASWSAGQTVLIAVDGNERAALSRIDNVGLERIRVARRPNKQHGAAADAALRVDRDGTPT